MAWNMSKAKRRALAALQLRDKNGRFIDMGKGVKWYSSKHKAEVSGVVEDGEGTRAIVRMSTGPEKGRLVYVEANQIEVIEAKASLNPKADAAAPGTEKQGIASAPTASKNAFAFEGKKLSEVSAEDMAKMPKGTALISPQNSSGSFTKADGDAWDQTLSNGDSGTTGNTSASVKNHDGFSDWTFSKEPATASVAKLPNSETAPEAPTPVEETAVPKYTDMADPQDKTGSYVPIISKTSDGNTYISAPEGSELYTPAKMLAVGDEVIAPDGAHPQKPFSMGKAWPNKSAERVNTAGPKIGKVLSIKEHAYALVQLPEGETVESTQKPGEQVNTVTIGLSNKVIKATPEMKAALADVIPEPVYSAPEAPVADADAVAKKQKRLDLLKTVPAGSTVTAKDNSVAYTKQEDGSWAANDGSGSFISENIAGFAEKSTVGFTMSAPTSEPVGEVLPEDEVSVIDAAGPSFASKLKEAPTSPYSLSGKDDVFGAFDGFNDAEIDGLKKYISTSMSANTALRKGGAVDQDSAKVIAGLDSIINRSVLQEDTKVYRGVSADASLVDMFNNKGMMKDRAFASTSVDKAFAEDWVSNTFSDALAPVVMEISLPKGFKAHKIDYDTVGTAFSNENEVILPRGLEFDITGVEEYTNPKGQKGYRVQATPILNEKNYDATGVKNDTGSTTDTGAAPDGAAPDAGTVPDNGNDSEQGGTVHMDAGSGDTPDSGGSGTEAPAESGTEADSTGDNGDNGPVEKTEAEKALDTATEALDALKQKLADDAEKASDEPFEPVLPSAQKTAPALVEPESALSEDWDAGGAWLKAVEDRYKANPKKAKATVQQSNNWGQVKKALNGDKNAAKDLLDSKYLDQKMYDDAVAGIEEHQAKMLASNPAPPGAKPGAKPLMGYKLEKNKNGVHVPTEFLSPGAQMGLFNGNIYPTSLPFMMQDTESGDTYYWDTNGTRRWGQYGASGALTRRKNADGQFEYLLAQRGAGMSSGANKWALPGGAHKYKSDAEGNGITAKIELEEELGFPVHGDPVANFKHEAAPDWAYDYAIFDAPEGQEPNWDDVDTREIQDLKWLTADEIKDMRDNGQLQEDMAVVLDDVLNASESVQKDEEATSTPESDSDAPEAPSEAADEASATPEEDPDAAYKAQVEKYMTVAKDADPEDVKMAIDMGIKMLKLSGWNPEGGEAEEADAPEAEAPEAVADAEAPTVAVDGPSVSMPDGKQAYVGSRVTHAKKGSGTVVKIIAGKSAKIEYDDGTSSIAQAHTINSFDGTPAANGPVDTSNMAPGEFGNNPSNGKLFIVGSDGSPMYQGDKVEATHQGETKTGVVKGIYKSVNSVAIVFDGEKKPSTKKAATVKSLEAAPEAAPEAPADAPEADAPAFDEQGLTPAESARLTELEAKMAEGWSKEVSEELDELYAKGDARLAGDDVPEAINEPEAAPEADVTPEEVVEPEEEVVEAPEVPVEAPEAPVEAPEESAPAFALGTRVARKGFANNKQFYVLGVDGDIAYVVPTPEGNFERGNYINDDTLKRYTVKTSDLTEVPHVGNQKLKDGWEKRFNERMEEKSPEGAALNPEPEAPEMEAEEDYPPLTTEEIAEKKYNYENSLIQLMDQGSKGDKLTSENLGLTFEKTGEGYWWKNVDTGDELLDDVLIEENTADDWLYAHAPEEVAEPVDVPSEVPDDALDGAGAPEMTSDEFWDMANKITDEAHAAPAGSKLVSKKLGLTYTKEATGVKWSNDSGDSLYPDTVVAGNKQSDDWEVIPNAKVTADSAPPMSTLDISSDGNYFIKTRDGDWELRLNGKKTGVKATSEQIDDISADSTFKIETPFTAPEVEDPAFEALRKKLQADEAPKSIPEGYDGAEELADWEKELLNGGSEPDAPEQPLNPAKFVSANGTVYNKPSHISQNLWDSYLDWEKENIGEVDIPDPEVYVAPNGAKYVKPSSMSPSDWYYLAGWEKELEGQLDGLPKNNYDEVQGTQLVAPSGADLDELYPLAKVVSSDPDQFEYTKSEDGATGYGDGVWMDQHGNTVTSEELANGADFKVVSFGEEPQADKDANAAKSALTFEYTEMPVGTIVGEINGDYFKKVDDNQWKGYFDGVESPNSPSSDEKIADLGKEYAEFGPQSAVLPDSETDAGLSITDIIEKLSKMPEGAIIGDPTSGNYKLKGDQWVPHVADTVVGWEPVLFDDAMAEIVLDNPNIFDVDKPTLPTAEPEKKSQMQIQQDLMKLPIGSKLGSPTGVQYEKMDANEWFDLFEGQFQGSSQYTDWDMADLVGNLPEYKMDSLVLPEGGVIEPDAPVTGQIGDLSKEDFKKVGIGTKVVYSETSDPSNPTGTYEKSSDTAWSYTPKGSTSPSAHNLENSIFDHLFEDGVDTSNYTIGEDVELNDFPEVVVDTNVTKNVKVLNDTAALELMPAGTTIKTEMETSFYYPNDSYYQKNLDGTWTHYKKTTSKLMNKGTYGSATLAGSLNKPVTVSKPASSDHFVAATGEIGYVGAKVINMHGDTYTVQKINKSGLQVTDADGLKYVKKPQDFTITPEFGKPSGTQSAYGPSDPLSKSSATHAQTVQEKLAAKQKAEKASENLKNFAGASADDYDASGVEMPSNAKPNLDKGLTVLETGEPDTSDPLYGTPKPVAPAEANNYPSFTPPSLADLPKWDSAKWLKDVEDRYIANPNKAKATVQQSNNWGLVQQAMGGDKGAVDQLLQSMYLTPEMRDEAIKGIEDQLEANKPLIDNHDKNVAEAKAAYEAKKAEDLKDVTAAKAKYKTEIASWIKANPSADSYKVAKKPAVSKEAFKGGEADWTKAHVGTYTAQAVMDAIRDDNVLGVHGLSVATDSDQIEDLDVKMTKVLDSTGAEKLEMKFKLTAPNGLVLQAALDADATVSKDTSGIYPSNMVKDPATGLFKDSGKPTNGFVNSGKRYEWTDQMTGAKIVFQKAFDTGYNVSSNDNTVKIHMPTDSTPELYQQTLENLGIKKARPSTSGDIKVLAENKLISLMGEHTSTVKTFDGRINMTGDDRKKTLEKIKQQYGVTPEDLTFSTEPNGRVRFSLSDEKATEMAKKYKVDYFYHSVSSSSDVDRWVNMIGGVNPGLLSTYHRFTEGIGGHGASSTSDMGNGSGDYVYVTPKSTHGNVKKPAEYAGIVMKSKALFKRVDIWANPGDGWGKKAEGGSTSNKAPYKLFDQVGSVSGGVYEFLPKDSVPVSDWAYAVIPGSVIQQVRDKLTAMGILEINGLPLDQFLITPGSTPPIDLTATGEV